MTMKKKLSNDKSRFVRSHNSVGEAIFKPGQSVDEHKHETAYEVFYIQSGKAEFVVNGEVYLVQEGDCVTIEPNEPHLQRNPFSADVVWLYFMVAID
mgnify:CR=1 FL=1